MKIKTIPEDFIVEELYDLDELKLRDEKLGSCYYYFILEKRDYTQIKALEKIARIFGVSRKNIHFAGTKDRFAITRQIISIRGIKKNNFQKNLDFFNEKIMDMNLKYIGIFKSRINLSDNNGNKFQITIRDLEKESQNKTESKIKSIQKEGLINYYDSQRFGFSNNSHLIGKFLIQDKIQSACYEILSAKPINNSNEKIEFFSNFIIDNWKEITNSNEEIINQAIDLSKKNSFETYMLKHLRKYKNDFMGAFRTIHKKQRTLYIAAYQSYIFNETIKNFSIGDFPKNYELELIWSEFNPDDKFKEKSLELLKKDNLNLDKLKMPRMPEIKPLKASRKIITFPKKIKIIHFENDDLNEGKMKLTISFELEKGSYATNFIKELF
jgi:tRNA pseudouridine13 synthase